MLLVSSINHIINVYFPLDIRTQDLSLKLTLPHPYGLFLLSEFASIGCYIVKFFLCVLLDVGNILPFQIVQYELILVVPLLLHLHALVKFSLVTLSLHPLNYLFKLQTLLSLLNARSFLLKIVIFLRLWFKKAKH